MNNRTVPFEIPDVNHGFVEVKGLLHVKKEALSLEFDQRDAFIGVIKSDLKEVTIPFSEIDSLRIKKRFWSTKVEITGTSMRSLREIPGAEQGRCTLKIKRKNREAAENVLSNARLALSEFKLRRLDE